MAAGPECRAQVVQQRVEGAVHLRGGRVLVERGRQHDDARAERRERRAERVAAAERDRAAGEQAGTEQIRGVHRGVTLRRVGRGRAGYG